MPLIMGLDVGTQGARAIACNEAGNVVAQSSCKFCEDVNVKGLPKGWFEQNPEVWWDTLKKVINEVIKTVNASGYCPKDIVSIAVDSTSGTILPVNKKGEALRPALMYSDNRAEYESQLCNSASGGFDKKIGYKFNSSFGLPKILWLMKNEPDTWQQTERFIHASDFIVGKLTAIYDVSDNSNALKTGYDLIDNCWPDFISSELGISNSKLPYVLSPGEPIGKITPKCAEETGLHEGTPVVGGVSDGTAGFIASGASSPGEWNSTLGTTLVIRGVSEELIRDAIGRIYCHRHPDGYWLPGGASNVGGECLSKTFPNVDYNIINKNIEDFIPTNIILYPLARRGERLPFIDETAEGFIVGNAKNETELFAAYLEGVAFVERWCYELMKDLGAPTGDSLYSTGGGSTNVVWARIRASMLKRQIIKPAITECAMGTAIVAASRILFSSLAEASKAMVKQDIKIDPDPHLTDLYDEKYALFRNECSARGLGNKTY